MSDKTEQQAAEWYEVIGKTAYECIAEMVAALECDYERMQELREELRDTYETAINDKTTDGMFRNWLKEMAEGDTDLQEDAEELLELEEAAGDCEDRDDAETRICEDPLSVEVRSGWVLPGKDNMGGPEEFKILLSTGGPATQIRGELDEDGEPCRAWLEVQDWFKPWTQYNGADQDTLLTYARCFSYGR